MAAGYVKTSFITSGTYVYHTLQRLTDLQPINNNAVSSEIINFDNIGVRYIDTELILLIGIDRYTKLGHIYLFSVKVTI